MDMVVIEVTDIAGVARVDEVVVIGKQGKGEISAEEFADKSRNDKLRNRHEN